MKQNKYRIVLIGAGNVATHLGLALKDAGNDVIQLWSKHEKNAKHLASKLNCNWIVDIKKVDDSAKVYIIAVKDDFILPIIKDLKLKNKLIIHTSGSADIIETGNKSNDYGVLYPVQTFSKNRTLNFSSIPICIEAKNKKALKILKELVVGLSPKIILVSAKQRNTIHLAAVFVNNFANNLFAIAEKILKNNKLNFEVLKPLIEETASKIKNNSPLKMQTGPAIRGDVKTIKKLERMIEDEKHILKLFKIHSELIAQLK